MERKAQRQKKRRKDLAKRLELLVLGKQEKDSGLAEVEEKAKEEEKGRGKGKGKKDGPRLVCRKAFLHSEVYVVSVDNDLLQNIGQAYKDTDLILNVVSCTGKFKSRSTNFAQTKVFNLFNFTFRSVNPGLGNSP